MTCLVYWLKFDLPHTWVRNTRWALYLVWFDKSSLPITLLPFVVVHKLTHSRLREHEHSWEWLRPQLIASIHNSDSNLCLESRRQCLTSLSLKKDRGVSLDNVTPQLRADRAECSDRRSVVTQEPSRRKSLHQKPHISPQWMLSSCTRHLRGCSFIKSASSRKTITVWFQSMMIISTK